MTLSVQYFSNLSDPSSKCWELLPLALDVDAVTIIARDGLQHVSEHFGAKGFRIFNLAGVAVAEGAL